MWQVVLTGDENNQKIAKQIYGNDYFPQKFTFLRDAKILISKLQELKVKSKTESEIQAKQSLKKEERKTRRNKK